MDGRGRPIAPPCRHRLKAIIISMNNGSRISFLDSWEVVSREVVFVEESDGYANDFLRLRREKQLKEKHSQLPLVGMILIGNRDYGILIHDAPRSKVFPV